MTRKKKGRGRPKGARNQASIVREVARMLTTISDGGVETRVTVAESMLRLLERRTMTGDIQADRALSRLRQRIAPDDDEAGVLLVPEPLDAAEWVRRQMILNRNRRPPDEDGSSKPHGGSSGPQPQPPGPDSGPGRGPGVGPDDGPSSGPQPAPRPKPPSPPRKPSMRNRLIR